MWIDRFATFEECNAAVEAIEAQEAEHQGVLLRPTSGKNRACLVIAIVQNRNVFLYTPVRPC